MSYCKTYGKDKVIFVTQEDHAIPSTVQLPPPEPSPGLVLPTGDINWNCPCLGGMATGPCGVEFRDAFSCFHYSEAEPKGSDCYDAFKQMQDCFSKFPTVYNKSSADNDDDDVGIDIPNMPREEMEKNQPNKPADDEDDRNPKIHDLSDSLQKSALDSINEGNDTVELIEDKISSGATDRK